MRAAMQSARRHAPFWLSLLAGKAVWEIVGRNSSAAFMVPLSETLVRLAEIAKSGQLGAQFLDSAALFITGFALAFLVGMPGGLLLARVRAVRVGIEPYIMVL
ncbi:MAG TPA: hypothetical protein VGJ75_12015, partial [Dongiaceae bacterium]